MTQRSSVTVNKSYREGFSLPPPPRFIVRVFFLVFRFVCFVGIVLVAVVIVWAVIDVRRSCCG